jgi:hypothetical protein
MPYCSGLYISVIVEIRKGGISKMTEKVKFSIPKSVKSNKPMFKSIMEMIVVTLMAQHLSINWAKSGGF